MLLFLIPILFDDGRYLTSANFSLTRGGDVGAMYSTQLHFNLV